MNMPRASTWCLVLAARRYFLDGASRGEIARGAGHLRWSCPPARRRPPRWDRPRIEIGAPPEIDVGSRPSLRLAMAEYARSWVGTIDGPDGFRESSKPGVRADAPRRRWRRTTSLGISWGRTLHAMVRSVRLPAMRTSIRSWAASPPRNSISSSMEVVRRVAGAPAARVSASSAVARRQSGDGRRAQGDPHVHKTIAISDHLTTKQSWASAPGLPADRPFVRHRGNDGCCSARRSRPNT